MAEILFSIFMCARNAEKTIKIAIDSVLGQTFPEWELIIVDNGSTDNTWKLIEDVGKGDSRIRCIHLEQGIGWAKGASLCLEKAQGKYMTFLAADDFLMGDGGLDTVKKCINQENPDIVWIGHVLTQYNEGKGYRISGGEIPEYKIYDGTDKINTVREIMYSLYYSSFFHFISIELLKNNKIDFYEPYYGDYEGVTEAMCQAVKTVAVNQALYALTVNTSQTAGRVTWKYNVSQWKSIKRVVCENGAYNKEHLRDIAIRIMNNNLTMLKGICNGQPLRDMEMNPLDKTLLERLVYVKESLELPEFSEMLYYAGKRKCEEGTLEDIKNLYEQSIREEYSREEIAQKIQWVDWLVWGFYEYDEVHKQFEARNVFDTECIRNMKEALCNEYNTGMFGFELIEKMLPYVTADSQIFLQEILQSYKNYILRRIEELLYIAREIKKRGRMEEVSVIVRECREILEMVRQQMTENDFMQVVEDLQMVGSAS